jgi:Flp pilus assembly secretin CpaC
MRPLQGRRQECRRSLGGPLNLPDWPTVLLSPNMPRPTCLPICIAAAILGSGNILAADVEDAVVKVAAAKPARVMVEVKFMEITLSVEKTRLGETLPTTLAALAPGLELTRIDTPSALRANLESTLVVDFSDNVKTNSSIQVDGYSSHHWAGRLDPAQFRSVIRTFEQIDGVEILSAPRATTEDVRQVHISVIDRLTLPTGLQSIIPTEEATAREEGESRFSMKKVSAGLTLDLLPYVSSDRKSVRMTVIPSHTEFLGFDEPSERLGRTAAQKLKKKGLTMAFPRVRVRSTVTDVVVTDGETFVIGLPTVTDEKIERKGLFRRKKKISNAKHLIVFVTLTIVDAVGQPVNARK